MFSVAQKRQIAAKVQQILRDTNHPELPKGEISFQLNVAGNGPLSWAQIRNNGAVSEADAESTKNPHNERVAEMMQRGEI